MDQYIIMMVNIHFQAGVKYPHDLTHHLIDQVNQIKGFLFLFLISIRLGFTVTNFRLFDNR